MKIVLLATAFGVATGLGARWERALTAPVQVEEDAEAALGSQRLKSLPEAFSATYTFRNFNRDELTIDYRMGKSALAKYEASFGYYKKELDALKAWHHGARTDPYQSAIKNGQSQDKLDAAFKALQADYDRRINDYLASRGFRRLNSNTISVDMPLLVKRNGPLLNELARAFETLATKQNYDSESLIGAAASMVQTAMVYQEPPVIDDDSRRTGGILQPVTALVRGWGDCDTKTGLLASLLSNWPHMRMVGVSVPGHYLMGVLRIPNKGDLFVEYEGLQYVLIEPAGPAWLVPGTVARTSVALLENQDGYRIDPFF